MKELLAFLGGLVAITLFFLNRFSAKEAKKKELDAEIDKADSITDFIRIHDKLRNR